MKLNMRTRAVGLLVAGVLALSVGSATADNTKPTKANQPDNRHFLGLPSETNGPGAPTKEKADRSDPNTVTMHLLRDGKYVEINVPVRHVKKVDEATGQLVDQPTVTEDDVQAELSKKGIAPLKPGETLRPPGSPEGTPGR